MYKLASVDSCPVAEKKINTDEKYDFMSER